MNHFNRMGFQGGGGIKITAEQSAAIVAAAAGYFTVTGATGTGEWNSSSSSSSSGTSTSTSSSNSSGWRQGDTSQSAAATSQQQQHHMWGQWGSCTGCSSTSGGHDWSKRSTRGQYKHKGGASRRGAKILERRGRRYEKAKNPRPEFTILPRGVSQSSFWWRRKVRTAKEGGRRQRTTVWARAKSKTTE